MGIQKDLLAISRAKRNSTRVASDGYYFAYCFKDNDYYEVEKGYYLDESCDEVPADQLPQFDTEFSPFSNENMEGEVDYDFDNEEDSYNQDYDDEYELEYEDSVDI